MPPETPRLEVALVGFNVGNNVPLGLGCLKAYALAQEDLPRQVRIRLHSYDFHVSPERVVSDLAARRPRIVGINTMHGSLTKALTLARYLAGLEPDTRVVLGGVEVTPIAGEVLEGNPEVECVVCGEGEETFFELVRRHLEGEPWSGARGTAGRRGGQVIRNPPRPVLDLRRLPSPYLAGVLDPDRFPAVHLETSRGCVFHCEYCFEGRGFDGVRELPLEQVLEEIDFVLASGCRVVKFFDATFNLHRDRTVRILEHLAVHNRHGIRFGAEVRMEMFDPELAQLARRANLIDIETGLQSLDPQTLSAHARSFDRSRFEHHVRAAVAAGLRVMVHIMAGLPGDRLEGTLRAHDYVLGLGAQPCLFHTRVLPGTELHRQAAARGVVFEPTSPYDLLKNPTFSLADHRRYNRFGLARAVAGPYLPVLLLLAEATGTSPSALFERIAAGLDGEPSWQEITDRYLWWRHGADPAFEAHLSRFTACWQRGVGDLVAAESRQLPAAHRGTLAAYLRYLFALEQVKGLAPPPARGEAGAVRIGLATRLEPAPGQRLVRLDYDVLPWIRGAVGGWQEIDAAAVWLLIQRTRNGTLTHAINREMRDFLRAFDGGARVGRAIESRGADPTADARGTASLLAVAQDLVEKGALRVDEEHRELIRSERLSLQRLDRDDLPRVLGVYRDNPSFFRLLTGSTSVPEDYVRSDMEEGPPDGRGRKFFLGLVLLGSGELAGVADFVVSYPVPGEGCLGLLLLAERHQGRGLGAEAVALLERWARRDHGVREVGLGVELVNERGRGFWRARGFEPTGEIFETTTLGRTHPTEWLHKTLTEPAPSSVRR